MKFIIITVIVCVLSIGALVSLADTSEATSEAQESSIGINTSGRVGLKLDSNLCVDPTNGQVGFCF